MLTLNAVAISDGLVLPTGKVSGQVHSIHNDFVNILTPHGIITLVRAGMVHIPFGIEVELSSGWVNTGLMQNQSIVYHGDSIILHETMVVTGLHDCRRFSCKPSYSLSVDHVDFLQRLQYLQKIYNNVSEVGGILTYLGQYDAQSFCMNDTSSELLESRVSQRVRSLVSGVIKNNEYLMIEGICGLLGVGPGSTPSGDDFLLGFLSAICHVQHDNCRATSEIMAYHMIENAKNLTTFLSVEYIKYGVRDLYHQRFSEMISAFVAGTEEEMAGAAQQLMTLGHSSGIDLLVGFIYGGFTALSAGIVATTKGERNEYL